MPRHWWKSRSERPPGWWKEALAEAVGTFLLTFVAAGAVCTDSYSGGEVGLVGVALANGLALAVAVTAVGHISGGHVNPAVTLAAFICRALPASRAVLYVACQLLGGIVAGLLLAGTFAPDIWGPVQLGAPTLGAGVAPGTGIFLEAVLAFLLVLTVLQVAMDPRAPRHVYGFAIGAALAFDVLVGGPLTGAAVNPARAFGPAFAAGIWLDPQHAVYWIGPLLGGTVAAFVSLGLRSRPRHTSVE